MARWLVQLYSDCYVLTERADGADIFRVEGRRLLSDDGMGTWEEQVVFTAPVRILFWKPTTRSRVHQRIDASDPGRITVQFMLLQSVSQLV